MRGKTGDRFAVGKKARPMGARPTPLLRLSCGLWREVVCLWQRIFVQMVVWRKAGDPVQSAKKRDQWVRGGQKRQRQGQPLAQPPCLAQQKPRGVGKKPCYSWWWCEVCARDSSPLFLVFPSSLCQPPSSLYMCHARLLPSSMSSSNGWCVAGAVGDHQSAKYRPPPLTSRYCARPTTDSGWRYS